MRIFLLSTLLAGTTLILQASDTSYEKGRTLYYANGCANCHGTNAEGSSYYPKLANKKQDFLKEKLANFKRGVAMTQKQEIMFTFANTLSKKDIANISYFLNNFKKEESDKYEIEEDLLGVDY